MEGVRLDRLQRKMISYEYLLDCVMFTDDPVLRVLSEDKAKQDQVGLLIDVCLCVCVCA